jgi:hypothetical protein
MSFDSRSVINLVALRTWLVEEHGYQGSARTSQRSVRVALRWPAKCSRRRVQTSPRVSNNY